MAICDDIFAAFAILEGSGGDEERKRLICQAAEGTLARRLRPEIAPEDCRSAFVMAGAFLARAMYLDARGTGGLGSISAGDFTVGIASPEGQRLAEAAERLVAPYLGSGFAFAGVRG